MLLGRTVWTRDDGVWRHQAFFGADGDARNSVTRLAEALSAAPGERMIAIFEPDGISHQTAETPKVSRTAFASLARVRNEHSVVESENLGWGIEYPELGPSGAFSTLIHSELTPGLIHVRNSCARVGSRLSAAWSAYTAAVVCANSGSSAPKAKFVLMLIPEYAAVATFGGGKRSFRSWSGPMSERDWKAFSVLNTAS